MVCCCDVDLREHLEFAAEARACLCECLSFSQESVALTLRLCATQITVIVFTVLHPLGLFASFVYDKLIKDKRTQPVMLPPDEEASAPRQIDEDATWG